MYFFPFPHTALREKFVFYFTHSAYKCKQCCQKCTKFHICPDASEAYIRGITPWLYGFAAVAVVVGAIGILCDTKVITLGRIWTYVELGAFLAALFAFVSGMRNHLSIT